MLRSNLSSILQVGVGYPRRYTPNLLSGSCQWNDAYSRGDAQSRRVELSKVLCGECRMDTLLS